MRATPAAEATSWFDREVRPFEPALKSYLRTSFPSLLDLDDFVQEAYARLFRAWGRGEVRHVRAFLFAVARNAALDDCRRRRVVRFEPLPESPDEGVPDVQPFVADVVSRRQELELLTEAVRQLPPRRREVVHLRLTHGLSLKDIGQRLGMSSLTAKTHLQRGIRDVVRRLETLNDQNITRVENRKVIPG
jgi:RNA polymerase sigma-70 factor (ECF subfamily)